MNDKMSQIILALISFVLIEPAWSVDPSQNFFYFQQMHHPSILTTAEQQASVAHLDLNQRLQERSVESNSPAKSETPTTTTNSVPTAPVLHQLPQLPLLQIPQHNRFQQIYGPSHVTTFFHNTLAGPLPFPFQPVNPYQNIISRPTLPPLQNQPILFQRPIPQFSPFVNINSLPTLPPLPLPSAEPPQPSPSPSIPSTSPPPSVPDSTSPSVPPPSQPSPSVALKPQILPFVPSLPTLPVEPMPHLSTISDAQKIFEVRQRAVTGYAYSIGSNDKIVATSSFTLGSSKHDPSFSRFKFLGQRPFENVENPYSSHLFQEKIQKQVISTTTAVPTVTKSSVVKPATNVPPKAQQPKLPKTTPVPEQKKMEKKEEVKIPNSTPETTTEVTLLSTTAEKTESVEVISNHQEKGNSPEAVIKSEPIPVETTTVSTTLAPKVTTEAVSSGNGDKNADDDFAEVLETKILTESSLKSAKPSGNSITLTEFEIPVGKVIVPNSGRVKGIRIVVDSDDNTVSTNTDAVRGVISSSAEGMLQAKSIDKANSTSTDISSGEKTANESTTQSETAMTELTTTEMPEGEVAIQISNEPADKSIAERVQPSVEISLVKPVFNSPNQLGEYNKVVEDDDVDSGGLPKGLEEDQYKYLQGILDNVSKGSQRLEADFDGYEVEERSYNANQPKLNSFETVPDDVIKLNMNRSTSLPPVSESPPTVPTTIPTSEPPTESASRSTVKTPSSTQTISPLHRYGTFESRYLPLPETQALKLLQAARFRKVGIIKNTRNTTVALEKKNLSDTADEKKFEPTKRPRVRVVVKTKQRNQRTRKIPPADPQ